MCQPCCTDLQPRLNSLRQLKEIDLGWTLYQYRDKPKKLLEALKFDSVAKLGDAWGCLLNHIEIPFSQVDYWVAVPIHQKRLKIRGFNQVEKVFSSLAEKEGAAISTILRRVVNTKPLFELSLAERRETLAGAFQLEGGPSLTGKTVLLLDDIVTTGTTLSLIAGIMKSAGAAQVWALVLTDAELSLS